MHVVTDTHSWIWFLTSNPRLSPNAKLTLSDTSNIIIIPSIVMMEIRYLYQHKRINLSFDEVLKQCEACKNIILYSLDISIVTAAPINLDIHDAIIVGTAIQLSRELGRPVPLVTEDKAITNSRLVDVIW
ncbi:MAG: type II toxin-antitoxin system VapC family toxin [Candidatus Anammoxibacter sp.]